MITDITNNNTDSLLLNKALLQDNVEEVKYAKITHVVQKISQTGDVYFQVHLRDLRGRPVIGRVFGDTAKKYATSWQEFSNTVCIIRYICETVFGHPSLNIISIIKPPAENMAKIRDCLFEGTIKDVDIDLNTISSAVSGKHAALYKQILQSSVFNKIGYYSDENLVNGKNGGLYVLLATCIKHIQQLQCRNLITTEECEEMCFALVTVEAFLALYADKDNFGRIPRSVCKITNLVSEFKEAEHLKKLCIAYMKERLHIDDQSTKLGHILMLTYSNCYAEFTMFSEFADITNGTVLKYHESFISNE